MSGDLLASISAEIDARLAELRPLVAEYERLLSAAGALGLDEPQADGAPARPAPRLAKGAAEGAASTSAASTNAVGTSGAGAPRTRATGARRRATGPRGSAAGAIVRAGSSPRSARKAEPGGREAAPRAARGAAQQAILAALEHGSHTVSELTVVTAMSGQNIRENLRRMLGSGAITRAKREGKAAYALAAAKAAGH